MHQCLKCKAKYEDDSVPIIDGCSCGSRMFLFIKQEGDLARAEEIRDELEAKIEEIKKEEAIEEPVEEQTRDSGLLKPRSGSELIEETIEEPEAKEIEKAPVQKPVKKHFGIETIKVNDIGIYEINLDALMKGHPIIVLAKGGSYVISLPSAFGRTSEIELR